MADYTPPTRSVEWGLANVYTLARRRLNAKNLAASEREWWEHVVRISIEAGVKQNGVLRHAVPTEITEGETPAMADDTVHVDTFSVTHDLRGRARTYEAVKAAVLAAGRFSIFEATATAADARLFNRLSDDPDLITDHTQPYPWIYVRRRDTTS